MDRQLTWLTVTMMGWYLLQSIGHSSLTESESKQAEQSSTKPRQLPPEIRQTKDHGCAW
jgi:hypothetical protein